MEPRALDFVRAFVWSFAVAVVLVVGFGVASALRPGLGTDAVFVGGWLAVVHALGAFAVRRVHPRPVGTAAALGVRTTSLRLLLLAVALGALVQIPITTLERVNEAWAPTPASVVAERAALLGAGSPGRVLLALLLLGCAAPLCQELFFRGVLYSGLSRASGARAAAVVTGVCFVVAHPDIRTWLPLSVLAGLLGFLRLRSGSVLPSLCLHVVHGTTLVYLGSLGPMGPASFFGSSPLWAVFGWIGVAILAYWAHRVATESRECALARVEDLS